MSEEVQKENKKGEEKEVKTHESKKKEALVTCRVLFISVLDKIYLVVLGLMLISTLYSTFSGRLSSMDYGFFRRVLGLIISLIVFAIVYLFFNWLYRCVAKTMLCVTEKEIYKEKYLPFKRSEITIPLNKVTSISTFNAFWIFRSVIICQYGKVPMIFFTWNNKEFKDKVTELIADRKVEIKNEYEEKNLINNNKIFIYIACAIVAITLLVGIVRFFSYIFSDAKKVPGTYQNDDIKLVLLKDGSCEMTQKNLNITSCDWNYYEESQKVNVSYRYEYTSYYGYTSTAYNHLSLDFNRKDKTLTSDNITLKKK